MNAKKAKAIRVQIPDWREADYDVKHHISKDPKKPRNVIQLVLKQHCGRSWYQQLKKEARHG